MTLKEALEKAKCGGCAGGRHPKYCNCNDFDYRLITKFAHKYPVGSIDIPTEIFGVTLDVEELSHNPRFQMYLVDMSMDVNDWMKTQ